MDQADVALSFLLGKRPARIITIMRASAPHTEASVSGRCFPDKRNRGVCFEEVRIDAGDDGMGMDPGAWAPLLIRDLPVFAWMPDGPDVKGAPWETSLRAAAGLIDKLLVDSSCFPAADDEAASRELRPLLRLRESTGSAFPISDFAWRRGRVLREQTARAFDPGDMRKRLSSLRAVRLYGGSPSEASLYFHWLQARLGRDLDVDHAAAGSLSEGFRILFSVDGSPDIDIGCTKGGCLSLGEEKGAYRFPSDGEILLEEVDTLVARPDLPAGARARRAPGLLTCPRFRRSWRRTPAPSPSWRASSCLRA